MLQDKTQDIIWEPCDYHFSDDTLKIICRCAIVPDGLVCLNCGHTVLSTGIRLTQAFKHRTQYQCVCQLLCNEEGLRSHCRDNIKAIDVMVTVLSMLCLVRCESFLCFLDTATNV